MLGVRLGAGIFRFKTLWEVSKIFRIPYRTYSGLCDFTTGCMCINVPLGFSFPEHVDPVGNQFDSDTHARLLILGTLDFFPISTAVVHGRPYRKFHSNKATVR